ncbi:DNTTIP1 [Cordylochernes scorpioides]|uniref:DNTTIP1 n=1 Tax=Cordylochernes scorpioides TaxID=51811 RepID=A0ABY6LNR0_9ARAC|nr:DNTTIP1 [Cordylochernes scorpioides]
MLRSKTRLTRLQKDTLNDKECCLLKQYILTDWPLHKKNLPSNFKPYWKFKEELHEWQNLICRGNKLLIPKTQRSEILKILHASHKGRDNTIALAKRFIYSPGMNKEIEELINNCSICQQTSKANLKEPMLPHQAPDYPWQKQSTQPPSSGQLSSPGSPKNWTYGSPKNLITTKSGYKMVNSENQNMVAWNNIFHMRPYNLTNFPTNTTSYRSANRSQAVAIQKAKIGFVTNSTKCLDLIRQNIQKLINKEIDTVIQKYISKFFKPGIENIKVNCEDGSMNNHLQAICRQVLEEAKKMYQSEPSRENSPCNGISDVENTVPPITIKYKVHKYHRKRKDSDTDSELYNPVGRPKKRKGRPPLIHNHSGRSTPSKLIPEQIKREGPKWDPDRLKPNSKFIMGAKANKALGLGNTRGRIYVKHPNIFKYSGDQDDKQWLCDHKLMPPIKGKAYMLLIEDIEELAASDEYRNSPALLPGEIVGFEVPEVMLKKMKQYMQSVRTDANLKKRGRSSDNGGVKPQPEKLPKLEPPFFQSEMNNSPSPMFLSVIKTESTTPSPNPVSPAPSDLSLSVDSSNFL